jgi:2'-5' RNA ligase
MHAHDRLYLQYRPDKLAHNQLLAWQSSGIEQNPQARAVQPDRIHLTVLHFGILADVFRELREQNDNLTKDIFMKAVEQFVLDTQDVLPQATTVYPERFELFGSGSSVLALRVRTSPELEQAHRRAFDMLIKCIASCGISQPEMFVPGSRNFRFAKKLQPHISLLKTARSKPTADVSIAQPLKLEVMPVHYQ